MDFELIWQKIVEFALMFYNYAMTQGESNFMLVDMNFINGKDVPDEAMYFFIGSFIVMILCAIFACDRFELFHPIEGIKDWKNKISIVKVVVFAAAIFSFHTFYKMLVGIGGGFLGADGSVRALDCLGSFINPMSLMIYAFAISTLSLRRGWFQAFMLGLAIFLTPSAMTFYGFTPEHIAIYSAAGAIALTGGILHALYMNDKCTPFVACFVLDIVYFISKFFMIFYSDQVTLITAEDWAGKIKQYLACVEMDLIFALILLLVLFAYKVATTENVSIKKNIVLPIILVLLTGASVFFGRTEMQYQPEYEDAVKLWERGRYEDALDAFTALNGYKDSDEYIDKCISKIGDPIYNQGLNYMEQGLYEDAYNEFVRIIDYKDSAEMVSECEQHMMYKLAGAWHGSQGTIIVLREDGTCNYYADISDGGEGTWSVDDENVIHINNSYLNYEIYADLDDKFRTTSMSIKSDSSNWRTESFTKVIDFEVNTENNHKLSGVWKGKQGSQLTLNEDGSCYYIDGNSGEGNGSWYVDEHALIRIDTQVFDYHIYGTLPEGYDTTTILLKATGWSWNDEEFTKE